ncbi:MAG: SMP-30/gluconolactonase/LRE family protein [Roseiflexaceae bacterium]
MHADSAPPVGIFAAADDRGTPAQPGVCHYLTADQSYLLTGPLAPAGHANTLFAWQLATGDVILTAQILLSGTDLAADHYAGLMMIAPHDPQFMVRVVLNGQGQVLLEYQAPGSADLHQHLLIDTHAHGPPLLQIERVGGQVAVAIAEAGAALQATMVPLPAWHGDLQIGLCADGQLGNPRTQALAQQVRLVVPGTDTSGWPRQGFRSLLEVVEIESGKRHVVLESPTIIEAPNWTPDDQALIYNSHGRLYRFDLATRTATEIPTDFATSNNNDHVISFDGRMLAISHHTGSERTSMVYVLPIEGGVPRQVTPNGPSYLHGWSPDGQFVVYTGLRNGDYDIYRIAVDEGAGPEEQLTDAPGLDDGPEYSPDGAWIYFNSVRSGLMQIWRMRPDGSGQEQVTDDEYNNWFPHISPDGQSIAFISYHQDVRPGDHPPAKRVYLRLMPASGGPIRVLAALYGGQGSNNVPSWSPDSQRLAFVSYSAEHSPRNEP